MSAKEIARPIAEGCSEAVAFDAPAEVDYFRHGGIAQRLLRQLLPT